MSTRLLVFLILQSYRFPAAGTFHCDLCGHSLTKALSLGQPPIGKMAKKLIVGEVYIFPRHAINKHMEVSICWWDLLYKIMQVCVCCGGHDSFTDTMIHALSKTITGIKINKYWKTGIKEGRLFLLPLLSALSGYSWYLCGKATGSSGQTPSGLVVSLF